MNEKAAIVTIEPLVLAREDAANFLSLSVTSFEDMVTRRELPQPRKLAKRRVGWLVSELRAWGEGLPVSDIAPPENSDYGRRGNKAVAECG